jgi:hypothetical protein
VQCAVHYMPFSCSSSLPPVPTATGAPDDTRLLISLLPTCPPPPGVPASVGAGIVAELALLARPRYHVCAGQGLFWQRPPYTNPDQGAGPRVTRFIALGRVGGNNNTNSSSSTSAAPKVLPAAGGLPPPPAAPAAAAAGPPAKFLHALGLVPAGDMSVEALSAVPDGSLACPYETRKRPAPAQAAEVSVCVGRGSAGVLAWQRGSSVGVAFKLERFACGHSMAAVW